MVGVTKHNTPALRFAGFSGGWDTPSLGDLGVPVSGVGFPHSEQGGEAGIPFFKVSDMSRSANERELLFAANYVSAEQVKKRGWQVVNGPAVAFAKVGAAVLLDRKRLVRERFLADNNMMAFVLSQTALTPDFALSLFGTLSLSSLVQVGALPSINGSQVKAMKVSIPPNLEEQRATGEFFADLDALIEQHRAKHANLQQTKTALMQRMFSQDGADEPELRLEGFNGAWVSRPLGDLGTPISGVGFPQSEQGGEVGTPFFKVSDMSRSANERELLFAANYVSAEQIRKRGWQVINGPAVVLAKVGAAVLLDRKRLVREPFLADNNMMAFVLSQTALTPDFALSLFETLSLSSLVQVGALPSINGSQVKAMQVSIPPTLEEQRAIGEIFADLDALIAAEHRYITQLTQAKTALLQRMFV